MYYENVSRLDRIILVGRRRWQGLSHQALDGLPPLLVLDPGGPERGPHRRGQEEEERQHWNQLEQHGCRAEPDAFPRPRLYLPLGLLLAQASKLEPPVVRKLAQSRAGDDDEGRCPDHGDEVEGEEDHELGDLDHAPGRVDGRGRRLAQHLDGGRGIGEEDSVRGDEIGLRLLDESGLRDAVSSVRLLSMGRGRVG